VPTTLQRRDWKIGTTIEIKFVNIVATFFDENLVMRTGPPGESISTFESEVF